MLHKMISSLYCLCTLLLCKPIYVTIPGHNKPTPRNTSASLLPHPFISLCLRAGSANTVHAAQPPAHHTICRTTCPLQPRTPHSLGIQTHNTHTYADPGSTLIKSRSQEGSQTPAIDRARSSLRARPVHHVRLACSNTPAHPPSRLPSNMADKYDAEAHQPPPPPEEADNDNDIDPSHLHSWRLFLVTTCLCLGAVLYGLDMNIIGVAVPVITTQFHSLDDIAWYSAAYLLTITAFQPAFGNVYKFFNAKRVFAGSVVLFEGML
jgi:hypothetical protein